MKEAILKLFKKRPRTQLEQLMTIINIGYTGKEALDIFCENNNLILPYHEDIQIDAFLKLKFIIKIVNDGWVPDFKNKEEKYIPLFNLERGFSYWSTAYSAANTCVPSALLINSENNVKFMVNNFIYLYEQYITTYNNI